MRAMIPLLAGAALLAACQAEPGDTSSPANQAGPEMAQPAAGEGVIDMNTDGPDPSECGADRLDRWLNTQLTEAVRTEIREEVGHDRIRFIGPDDAVTMDYVPNRLNVETGEDGNIQQIRCG